MIRKIIFIIGFLFFMHGASIVYSQTTIELLVSVENIEGLRDQLTVAGRTINQLYYFDEKVFVGYGDAGENTGPIAIVYYDTKLNSMANSNFIASTEAITNFCEFGGRLFIPNHDPRPDVDSNYGSLFCYDPKLTHWTKGNPLKGAVHVFGITHFRNRIFISTGSNYQIGAVVASSGNFGKTWSQKLKVAPINNDSSIEYVRLTNMAANSNTIFVSGHRHQTIHDSISKHVPIAYYLNKKKWKEIILKRPLGYLKSFCLNDSIYIIPSFSEIDSSYKHAVLVGGELMERRFFPPECKILKSVVNKSNPFIKNEWLLCIIEKDSGSTSIQITTDLKNWEIVFEFPSEHSHEISSLTYDPNKNVLYLGSKKGNLYCIKNFLNGKE